MENVIFYGNIRETDRKEKNTEYYMIEESISREYTDMSRYGIRIVQTLLYPGGGKSAEMKQLNNIFYKRDDAKNFMNAVIKNKVAPSELNRFVEKYIMKPLKKPLYLSECL